MCRPSQERARGRALRSGRAGSRQQAIQVAAAFEARHLVVAAHMRVADEDLRDSAAAMGALHHCHPRLLVGYVDLVERHALVLEQRLGGVAEGTPVGGVDLDLTHLRTGRHVAPYMGPPE